MRISIYSILIMIAALTCSGQTQINLGRQGKGPDFGSMTHTRPVQTGSQLPATCSVGELFFHSAAADGQNLHGCTAENVWGTLTGLGLCTLTSGGALTCPIRVESGGGGQAGELQLLEQAAQGADFVSLLAPDSIAAAYRLRLPSAPPENKALLFGAQVNGISDGSWVTWHTKTSETLYYPAAQRLGAAGWGLGPAWSLPEASGPVVSGGGVSPFQAGYLVFAASEKRDVLLQARIPSAWDAGMVTVKLIWAAPNGGSGTNVKWQASVACVEDGQDLMLPVFSPAMENVAAIPYPGDTAAKRITTAFGPAAWTGCTANSLVYLLISRDGTGDSNPGSVFLIGAQLDFMKGLE